MLTLSPPSPPPLPPLPSLPCPPLQHCRRVCPRRQLPATPKRHREPKPSLQQLCSRQAKEEFEAMKYKGKVKAKDAGAGPGPVGASSPAGEQQQHRKRRKVSAASFFADSEDDDDEGEEEAAAPIKDELKEYLALPQIKYKSEQDAMLWWLEHRQQFPNLEVMARQYLGCPATSATVERLFSKVGLAFSKLRKSAEAETLKALMFAQANLP